MNQNERINFSKSNIFWDGPSKGIFKLISVLRLNLGKSKKPETTFGLGESVLAGNMYVSEGLLKQPPYLFQVAGSTEEQYIFRSILPNQKKSLIPSWFINKVGDTHQKKLFNDGFYLDLKKSPASTVMNYDEIEKCFYDNNFTVKIQIDSLEFNYSIEFPVNHINIKPEIKMWQVETGPILMPNFEESKTGDLELLTGFIHFNSFDKLDVFYDYPFGYRRSQTINRGIMQSIDCKIEIFTN